MLQSFARVLLFVWSAAFCFRWAAASASVVSGKNILGLADPSVPVGGYQNALGSVSWRWYICRGLHEVWNVSRLWGLSKDKDAPIFIKVLLHSFFLEGAAVGARVDNVRR